MRYHIISKRKGENNDTIKYKGIILSQKRRRKIKEITVQSYELNEIYIFCSFAFVENIYSCKVMTI